MSYSSVCGTNHSLMCCSDKLFQRNPEAKLRPSLPNMSYPLLLSALLTIAISIALLNYYEIKYLRDLNEEVIRGFAIVDSRVDEEPSDRPRVWIEGKKVCFLLFEVNKL